LPCLSTPLYIIAFIFSVALFFSQCQSSSALPSAAAAVEQDFQLNSAVGQLTSPAADHHFLLNQQQCPSLSHSFSGQSAKRRQLPKTPTPQSPEDPLEKIDIATVTKEYLLSVLHQTNQQQKHPQRQQTTTTTAAAGGEEEYAMDVVEQPINGRRRGGSREDNMVRINNSKLF
jgi:hypothetical protein